MRQNWLNVPLNTQPNWLKPTQTHWQKHSAYRKRKTMLKEKPRFGSLIFGGMLLLLLLLSGCCTKPPIPPSVQPTNPMPPVSQLQPPAQTYSSSAAADIQQWQSRLTSGTAKP